MLIESAVKESIYLGNRKTLFRIRLTLLEKSFLAWDLSLQESPCVLGAQELSPFI